MGDSEEREAKFSTVNFALNYAEKKVVNEVEQTNKLNKNHIP
jgi:hypothetical protein